MGSKRKIWGFTAFIVSLLLSPLIGFLFTVLSKRLSDERHEKEMYNLQRMQYQLIEKQASEKWKKAESEPSELDALKKNKLAKLLDDWADGKITEEEYRIKKERIMLL